MALSVGSVLATLGARVDRRGFDEYDRRIGAADRSARDVHRAELGARVDDRGFREFDRRVERSERDTARGTARIGGHFRGMSAGIATGIGPATVGLAALGAELGRATLGWQDHEKVARQSEAVVKSTGGAAGVTAEQVGALSDAIERKTSVDGDAVQSGANLLLTFTNVRNEAGKGNDVFNQATKTLVDMAAALGSEPKDAAIQLGKALNDPIKGVTALTKVGVTFDDQQKKQIKTLVESGKTINAQKIILKELNKEFGGSAQAQATGWSRLLVPIHALEDAVGSVLLPVLDKALGFTTRFLQGVADGEGTAGKLGSGIKSLAATIGGTFRSAITTGRNLIHGFGEFIDDNRGKINDLGRGISRFASLVLSGLRRAKQSFDDTFGGDSGVGADIKKIASTLLALASTVVNKVIDPIVKRALPGLEAAFSGLLRVIRGVIKLIAGILTGDFGKAWDGVKDIFSGAVKALGGIIRAGTAPIRGAAAAVAKAIGGALSSGWEFAKTQAGNFVNDIIDIVNKIPFVGKIKHVTWGTSDVKAPKGGNGGGGTTNSSAPKAQGYAAGGRVPAAVSSGELIRDPSGRWAVVPGPPTAADNVLTMLEPDSEVYTWDGQAKLARGMSRNQVLASQAPHFSVGGVVNKVVDTAKDIVSAPVDLISKGAGWLVDQLPSVPSGSPLSGLLGHVKDKAVDWIKDKFESLLGADTGGGGETSTHGLVAQVVRAVAYARAHGWSGQVTSGYRTPAEQIAAGTRFAAQLGKPVSAVYPNGLLASSHVKGQAVDVTDPGGFARALVGAPAGSKITNRLPWDPVHFSVTGYGNGGKVPAYLKGANSVHAERRARDFARGIGALDDFDPLASLTEERDDYLKGARDALRKTLAGSGKNADGSTITQLAAAARRSRDPRVWLTNALKITGHYNGGNLAALYRRAKGESGLNPKAINLHDSNARAGHPSQGLLQTIPATFAKYRLPSIGGGITDVIANPVAGIRYMFGRYGHIVDWNGKGYGAGGVVQFFGKGGKARQSSFVATGITGAGLVNSGVQRSVSRGEKGIAPFEKRIQSLEREYTQMDRATSITPIDYVTENDDGSTTVNSGAVNERLKQIDALIAKREQIRKAIEDYKAKVQELIVTYQAAVDRLKQAIKATPGKARAKTRAGYQSTIDDYTQRIGELGDTFGDLGFDLKDADLDLAELRNERGVVAGATGKAADPSAAGDTTTTTPTAADIAAAALQDFTNFQTNRQNLLASFGSNFVGPQGAQPSALGDAAGSRYYGAAQGPQTVVHQTINYASGPADPSTQAHQLRYQLQGVI